jgi:amino acid transporter
MTTLDRSEFDVVMLPAREHQRGRLVLVSSVALSFISFWRAAAIVLNDMASTVYYIGGISEQAVGKAAPWFVLGVMLFAYAVRSVYVESCTMFTRGGVYRVVKEAMGGPLAKLSVSALMFDYVLTGPISAVSAGQYLVGMAGNLLALPPLNWQLNAATHPELVKFLSMLIAVGITLYFWRINLIGIHESSAKAMRIMQLTTVMGVIVILWAGFTLAWRPELRHLPPLRPVLTPESQGWLVHFPQIVGTIGILVAFGHTLLAMSGEESLAQVYREIEAPKVPNLLKAGAVIALYSLVLTGVVTFFAVMIIPDTERIKTEVVDGATRTEVVSVIERTTETGGTRRVATVEGGGTFDVPPAATVERASGKYTDNLISGLVMHLLGPPWLRLALQAFVVFVGFLILSGAVNTSIVGSNGVLNRLAEDGILTPWFLHPQPRFGTTHRLINIVCILQLLTIVASMGDVYTLGEAYAFGVIWSFVFKTLAMVVLRFKDKSPREYEVPLNLRVPVRRVPRAARGTDAPAGNHIDLPVGITIIFLILASTAVVNLFTKKVATVWGIGFTLGFLAVFVVCEQLSRRLRRGRTHAHLEQFIEKVTDHPTPQALGLGHRSPVMVAIRNPRSIAVLERVLRETDTTRRDVVAVTCKVLPPLTPGITPQELSVDDNDREVLTRVVNLAERAGKPIYPLVIPTNNPLYAIATAARDLGATEVVLGTSEKASADVQMEQFALAWGMAGADASPLSGLLVRILGAGTEVRHALE